MGMTKAEQSDASRGRLVAAATDLFAEQGYRGTSVQQIGERAGISRGSIFWHFGSKEGLLLAVVDRAFASWETEGLGPEVGDATGTEAIRRGLRSHQRFLSDARGPIRLFFVLLFEALGPRPELQEHFVRFYAHFRAVLAEWIAAGQASGDLRAEADAKAVAGTLVATIGGLAYQSLLDETLDLDAVYAALADTFTRGLAA